jgi:lipoprotein NlpI
MRVRFVPMLRILIALSLIAGAFAADAPKVAPPYEDAMFAARDAERKGLLGQALERLAQAESIDPKRVDAYFLQGRILALQRKRDAAVLAFDKVIELDPKASTAYNLRGFEHFKENRIDQAIQDFNKYIALEPQQEPYHWQRGIAYYYAGRFEDGRKQFELHQTVNPHDVENAVWHFLCVARAQGVEKARAALIPISGDRRVPMSEVYELFAGKITPEDVLKATKKGEPTAVQLEDREFFAHLYLGLYFEALGDNKKAYAHIKKAATDYGAEHYMGDVARVHFKRLLENPPR